MTMPMRVLHVVPTYVPAWVYGGPIKSVHGLCKGLARLGHDVHVFTTDVNGEAFLDVPHAMPVDVDGVQVRYFRSRLLKRIYRAPAMKDALGRELGSFDVLHLHSVFLWPTTIAARLARQLGTPYVLAPRGMLVKELIERKSRRIKTAWIDLFERSNIAGAACIHFTSRYEEQQARELGIAFRAHCIVPNGIDDEEICAEDAIMPPRGAARSGEPFVLILGRVNWNKGIDRMVKALQWMPGWRLVVAGNDEEGHRPELERLALEAGVAERVSFTGPVYGGAKADLLRRASALVLPSYSENFGNVVLEAMASACPVVVTPEVGSAELVRETGAGAVLEGEPRALAAGLNALLANQDALRRMGARGREAARARFGWKTIAAGMAEEYARVAAPRPDA